MTYFSAGILTDTEFYWIDLPQFFFFFFLVGLPWWLSSKESSWQCRRCRFNLWVGRIPWSRKWQPTPVFLPGKSLGQRSLVGYIQSMELQRSWTRLIDKTAKPPPPQFISCISSSTTSLFFCIPSFPAPESFPMSWLFHIRWPKYWNFSISPFNDYSGLISFRIDWFDLLAAQGTLKSLLQHHNSKASILRCSAFFMVQLSFRTWLPEKQ